MNTREHRKSAQVDESHAESTSMVGYPPPQFSLTAGEGDKRNKDGLYKPWQKVEGPLAEKGANDQHAFAPDDVKQGQLENCWFLGAVASIAKANPSLLENAIRDRGDGNFEVTLYARSSDDTKASLTPQIITVTRLYPFHTRIGKPLMAGYGEDNQEIWAMVLEKAFAKLNGGYEKIDRRAFLDEAYEAITGMESSSGYFSDRKSSKEEVDAKNDKMLKRFSKQNPGASSKDLERWAPKIETNLKSLHSWEIIPTFKRLQESGNAIALSTIDLGGIKKVGDFTILGPHVYALMDLNEGNNTVSLYDSNQYAHLVDFPVDLIAKYFEDFTYINVSKEPSAEINR